MPADAAQSLPSRADRGDKVIPEGGAARGWQGFDFLGPDFLFVDLAVQSAENLFRLVKFESRAVVFVRVLILIGGCVWLHIDLGPTLDLGYGARRQTAFRTMLANIRSEWMDG